MVILFSFASCSNSSASISNEPKIVSIFSLNGDTINLYDDLTFLILKGNNAGTISGTYTPISNGYKLVVKSASNNIAKQGDILTLNVNGENVSVTESDIEGYTEGDTGKQTDGNAQTMPNNSSSENGNQSEGNNGSSGTIQGSTSSDIDHSLGETPEGEQISEECFTVENCSEGIHMECDVPEETWKVSVYIDSIGHVAEYILDENTKTISFFYPFLTPGKEYTVRFVFEKEEDYDEEEYNLGHVNDDGFIGWTDMKVTAGAKSKGEVRLQDIGKIQVETNGDFKFTKKPTFENESLLSGKWVLGIGLCEGVSWLQTNRRNKWLTEIDIPNNELLGKTYNFYTYPRSWGDVTKVDFILYRPKLDYEHDGKSYRCMWHSETVETDCTTADDLRISINVNNSADVAKINGTWKTQSEWNDSSDGIPLHYFFIQTLAISSNTIKESTSWTYTKSNGSEFTKDDLLELWFCYDIYHYNVPESGADEFEKKLTEDETVLKFERTDSYQDESGTHYEYAIYSLNSNSTISSDGKTLFRNWNSEQLVSDRFADHNDNDGYSEHYDLNLFGDTLQIICSGKYANGEPFKYSTYYQKQ